VDSLPADRFRFTGVSTRNRVYAFGGQQLDDAECNCYKASDQVDVFVEVMPVPIVEPEDRRMGMKLGVSLGVFFAVVLLVLLLMDAYTRRQKRKKREAEEAKKKRKKKKKHSKSRKINSTGTEGTDDAV
jgi:hypothetical protein